jgi:mono/diheme cytochrome c family protein
MKKIIILSVLVAVLLSGCQQQTPVAEETGVAAESISGTTKDTSMGMGSGMGMSSGMRDRHHAAIPEVYAGRVNEVAADTASLQRGGEIFAVQCVSCHGEDGMGTGPAAAGLNPAPAPIARTSQMMSDAYLLWRISEGGVPFETLMPGWKEVLTEEEIWNVINYIQSLGGEMAGGPGMGRQDADAQAAMHAEMLIKAIEQEIITQAEADTFELVHAALDTYLEANPPEGVGAEDHQATALAALVEAGTLTQEQVDTFNSVHDRLVESGLMP